MASDELRRMFEADQDLRRQPPNSPWAHAPGSTSEVRHPVRASGPATLAMVAGRLARSLPAVGRGPRDDGRRAGRVGHPTPGDCARTGGDRPDAPASTAGTHDRQPQYD